MGIVNKWIFIFIEKYFIYCNKKKKYVLLWYDKKKIKCLNNKTKMVKLRFFSKSMELSREGLVRTYHGLWGSVGFSMVHSYTSHTIGEPVFV